MSGVQHEWVDDRKRFAHTAPWHVKIPGKPLHPRPEETDYLIGRVKAEIERNRGVLPEPAEFKEALRIYQKMAAKAARAGQWPGSGVAWFRGWMKAELFPARGQARS